MCIPHGMTSSKSNGYIDDKPKKTIQRVSKEQFEHGDPNFKDERVESSQESQKKKSFLDSIFGD